MVSHSMKRIVSDVRDTLKDRMNSSADEIEAEKDLRKKLLDIEIARKDAEDKKAEDAENKETEIRIMYGRHGNRNNHFYNINLMMLPRHGRDMSEVFENMYESLEDDREIFLPNHRIENLNNKYGKILVAALFYNEVLSDKYWNDFEKSSGYGKKMSDYEKECDTECEMYFSKQKKRDLPKLIKDSHYNPSDKTCLLNQKKPADYINGFPRNYYLMLR
ncbi:MAG: hypothetical protein ACP5NW_05650 [Candidatus Woesearchaeota archaeon]